MFSHSLKLTVAFFLNFISSSLRARGHRTECNKNLLDLRAFRADALFLDIPKIWYNDKCLENKLTHIMYVPNATHRDQKHNGTKNS